MSFSSTYSDDRLNEPLLNGAGKNFWAFLIYALAITRRNPPRHLQKELSIICIITEIFILPNLFIIAQDARIQLIFLVRCVCSENTISQYCLTSPLKEPKIAIVNKCSEPHRSIQR